MYISILLYSNKIWDEWRSGSVFGRYFIWKLKWLSQMDSEHIFSLSIQTITNTHTHWNNKIVTIISQPSSGNSWLSSLISTIIGNLKISISNVHIRYEDSVRLVYKYHFNFLCTVEVGMKNWHLFIFFIFLIEEVLVLFIFICLRTKVLFAVIQAIHFLQVWLWLSLLLLQWMSRGTKLLMQVAL